MSDSDERWRCAKCGRPSGMQGHYFTGVPGNIDGWTCHLENRRSKGPDYLTGSLIPKERRDVKK